MAKMNKTTKAQAIREIAKKMGRKPRPRDIVAALAAKGIKVAPAQVSTTLKRAGLRGGRRRGKVAASVNGRRRVSAVTANDLFAVKELAGQLGGTSKLKEAVAALEQLQ